MKGFRAFLAISFLIAMASAGVAFTPPKLYLYDFAGAAGLILAAAWLIIFVVSLRRFRWRGLWLLVGAPLAFYFPLLLAFYAVAENNYPWP
jgi:hypothetical protein